MSKVVVEKAPEFILGKTDTSQLEKYLSIHDITDTEGRYLHWSKLKWRVEPRSEAKNIWLAIKLKRILQSKYIPIKDAKGELFLYCIPHSMEAKLHQVVKIAGGSTAAISGEVASRQLKSHFLVSSLIMEEAISSAQLEGAAVTREVAKRMLETSSEPKNEDERMILNNYLLLKHAERSCKLSLTLDLILEFHKIATMGTTENRVIPGSFREADDIYVEDKSGDIAYQPPSHELIVQRLSLLCHFANEDHSGLNGSKFIPPVIKAIILHFMIGFEHPFRDGNGRTARALFYWFMLKNDYDLFKYVSISKLLKDNPKEYGMSYMYTETDQNDLTYFIDYQLDIILKAFEDLQKYLAEKASQFSEAIGLLESSQYSRKLNFQQKDIIKKAIKNPGRVFTVSEISNDYEISDNTARTYLNALLKYKLLLSSKDGRTTLYIAPSDLRERLKFNS
jgi:Fic family protein